MMQGKCVASWKFRSVFSHASFLLRYFFSPRPSPLYMLLFSVPSPSSSRPRSSFAPHTFNMTLRTAVLRSARLRPFPIPHPPSVLRAKKRLPSIPSRLPPPFSVSILRAALISVRLFFVSSPSFSSLHAPVFRVPPPSPARASCSFPPLRAKKIPRRREPAGEGIRGSCC